MKTLRTLFRTSIARLRSPSRWWPLAFWILFALVVAVAEKSVNATNGASQVLRSSFATVVVPLLSYAVVGQIVGNQGLASTMRGTVLLGAAPRQAAVTTLLAAAVTSAVLCASLAFIVCVVAHGALDPPLVRDALTSSGIGALGGACYGAYFSAGTSIGKGSFRGVLLVVDWLASGSDGTLAILTPRGHVTRLFGGPACADLSPRASSLVLFLLFAAFLALGTLLGSRSAGMARMVEET